MLYLAMLKNASQKFLDQNPEADDLQNLVIVQIYLRQNFMKIRSVAFT